MMEDLSGPGPQDYSQETARKWLEELYFSDRADRTSIPVMQGDIGWVARKLGYATNEDRFQADDFLKGGFDGTDTYWAACENLGLLILAAEGEI